MKTTINYIRSQVLPPLSFGLYLCVEGAVVYWLYRAIAK
jgi:hypothetical protein